MRPDTMTAIGYGSCILRSYRVNKYDSSEQGKYEMNKLHLKKSVIKNLGAEQISLAQGGGSSLIDIEISQFQNVNNTNNGNVQQRNNQRIDIGPLIRQGKEWLRRSARFFSIR